MKTYSLKKMRAALISLCFAAITTYGYADLSPKANERTKDIVEKIEEEMKKDCFEGMMLSEFTDKKSSIRLNSYNFDLDNAQILTSHYNKDDSRLIIYICDIHGKAFTKEELYSLHEKIYNTLDELYKENGIDLLVLEGADKELTKENLKGSRSSNDLPKNKYEALNSFASAGKAYEYMNDDKIDTFGGEDMDIYEFARKITFTQPKSEGRIWLHKEVVINKRSKIGVEKTLEYMEKTRKNKAILIFGAAHTRSIIESLENKGVSYIIIRPTGMDEVLLKYK